MDFPGGDTVSIVFDDEKTLPEEISEALQEGGFVLEGISELSPLGEPGQP